MKFDTRLEDESRNMEVNDVPSGDPSPTPDVSYAKIIRGVTEGEDLHCTAQIRVAKSTVDSKGNTNQY